MSLSILNTDPAAPFSADRGIPFHDSRTVADSQYVCRMHPAARIPSHLISALCMYLSLYLSVVEARRASRLPWVRRGWMCWGASRWGEWRGLRGWGLSRWRDVGVKSRWGGRGGGLCYRLGLGRGLGYCMVGGKSIVGMTRGELPLGDLGGE